MAAGAIAAGTVMKAEGIRQEARAAERDLRLSSEAKRLESFEILQRSQINRQLLGEEREVTQALQIGQFAASGVDVGSGTVLSVLEETSAEVARQQLLEKRVSDFEATALINASEREREKIGEVNRAANLRIFSTFLSAGGQAAASGG